MSCYFSYKRKEMANKDVLNTFTGFFFFLLLASKRKKEREKHKDLVRKEIVMFNLMKTSHAVLVTDFSDEKKRKR